MVPPYRVQKRTAESSQKKKRGRPKKYPESWTKKLLLLRMCGLHLNDIVRILENQSTVKFMAKDRRPQQLVRELLSDGKNRFSTPDRLTARKRAAFIRATISRNRTSRTSRSKSSTIAQEPLATHAIPGQTQIIDQILSAHISSTPLLVDLLDFEPLMPRFACTPNLRMSDYEYQSVRSCNTPSTESNRTTAYESGSTEIASQQYVDSPSTMDDIPHNRDSTVLIPSRKHQARRTFSNASFSSSFVSDLLSLLEKRFSLSTFTTTSRQSISAASIAISETSFSVGKATELFEQRELRIKVANAALLGQCCSKREDCRHRYISRLIENDPFLVLSRPGEMEAILCATPVVQSPSDPHGNNELFFAARVGAPPDVLISLIRVAIDVNAINADGQNFLYHLDPSLFTGRFCRCDRGQAHASKFECLLRTLERKRFNFDHLDHSGRHFLFYLCSMPSFETQWLSDLTLRDTDWQQRVWNVAQLRDSTGTFLIDFMALHPGFEDLSEDVRSQFRPLFVHNPTDSEQSGILSDEDENGATHLHQYIQRDFLQTAPLHEVPLPFEVITANINRYNIHGRSPTMDFLLKAIEQDIGEESICAKVQQLLNCGANVNARSRGGSTMLHFAAKKALPKLLEVLLATNIQVDHCDNEGFSALDYAAKVFNRSRSAKAPAELTARSLKSTAQLLGLVSNAFGKSRHTNATNTGTPTNDISERSLKTLQKMLGLKGQKYPPSYSSNGTRRAGMIQLPVLEPMHQLDLFSPEMSKQYV